MRGWIRAALVGAALAMSGHVGAQSPAPPPPLATALTPLLAGAVPGAEIAVVVMEATSGRVLFERGADTALNPASDTKLLTAATALAVLGADHRFTTTLHGAASGDSVAGPLVLRGAGDPSLTAADLYTLARELASAGVRRVEGDLVVDDTALGSEHLPPAFEQRPDEHAPFRASVGAVSVDENVLTVRVRAGSPGGPAWISAEPRGFVDIDPGVVTVAGGAASLGVTVTPRSDGRALARVAGTIPAGGAAVVLRRRLDNPSLAAGCAMRSVLADVGIVVVGAVRVGPTPAGLTLLATHQSRPLSALLYEVGKDSNNFYAEMTLLAIAASDASSPASFQRGVDRVVAWCREAGVDVRGMRLRNGSGLYDANRVSARQLAQVLRANWRRPVVREEFIAQLAVGGGDGTLRNRLRLAGAEGMVRAKTGTLDDVIALSGFILAPDPARTLVFSVIANGVRGHGPAARRIADQIVTALVQRVRAPR